MKYSKYLKLNTIFSILCVCTAQAADISTHAKAITAYRQAGNAMPPGFAGSDSQALLQDVGQASATNTNKWVKGKAIAALDAAIDVLVPGAGNLLHINGLVNAPGGAGGHVVAGDATHPADRSPAAFKAAIIALILAYPDAVAIAGPASVHWNDISRAKRLVTTALATHLVTWLQPYTNGALVAGTPLAPATIGVGANTANAVILAAAFAHRVAAGWTGGNNVDGFVTFLTETVQNAR